MTPLTGLHHLTAITADAPGNNRFYTGTLGLRRVKKTVNQDDTSAYHLFFADAAGSPGTDVTFFDWPAARERRGSGAVSRTGLRVDEGSLGFWTDRLRDAGIVTAEDAMDGRPGIAFTDPEGQRLRLVGVPDGASRHPWDGTDIPAGHQIGGLGPIVMTVADPAATDAVLTGPMGMRAERRYDGEDGPVTVYAMAEGGAAAELHVAAAPGLPAARQGAGGVHHVAFRLPDADALRAWSDHLTRAGIRNTGEIDRFYFRSLYFREPGGVLFELATDGPGFDADEPAATMGQGLSLPPFLEPKRAQIEAGLKPLA